MIGFGQGRDKQNIGLFASAKVREEFHRICEKLLRAAGAPGKSFVVVGPKGGEGVSTVVWNMGYILASGENVRTLLIDANLRRPALHGAASLELMPGLTDCDGKDAPSYRNVSALSPNLSVLTAGSRHAGCSWDQLAPLLPRILAHAEKAFDIIIWDAAPIGEYPETLPLLRTARRAVLVAESDQTTLSSLAYAREQIAVAGAEVAGVVLNRRGRFVPRWLPH